MLTTFLLSSSITANPALAVQWTSGINYGFDYKVSHIEVTQGIQDKINSVTLVNSKDTWVRVYVDVNPIQKTNDESNSDSITSIVSQTVNPEYSDMIVPTAFESSSAGIPTTPKISGELDDIENPFEDPPFNPQGTSGVDCKEFFETELDSLYLYEPFMGEKISQGIVWDSFGKMNGKYIHFENASIFCEHNLEFQVVKEPFREKYAELGWAEGILGLPTGATPPNDILLHEHPQDSTQILQEKEFQGGSLIFDPLQNLIFVIPGPLHSEWGGLEESGVPIGNPFPIYDYEGSLQQNFAEKSTCFHPDLGTWSIYGNSPDCIDTIENSLWAKLHAVNRDGDILFSTISKIDNPEILVGKTWEEQRRSADSSINFKIPGQWMVESPNLQLMVELNPKLGDGKILRTEVNYENNFYGPLRLDFIQTKAYPVDVHKVSTEDCNLSHVSFDNLNEKMNFSKSIFPTSFSIKMEDSIHLANKPGVSGWPGFYGLILMQELAYEQCKEKKILDFSLNPLDNFDRAQCEAAHAVGNYVDGVISAVSNDEGGQAAGTGAEMLLAIDDLFEHSKQTEVGFSCNGDAGIGFPSKAFVANNPNNDGDQTTMAHELMHALMKSTHVPIDPRVYWDDVEIKEIVDSTGVKSSSVSSINFPDFNININVVHPNGSSDFNIKCTDSKPLNSPLILGEIVQLGEILEDDNYPYYDSRLAQDFPPNKFPPGTLHRPSIGEVGFDGEKALIPELYSDFMSYCSTSRIGGDPYDLKYGGNWISPYHHEKLVNHFKIFDTKDPQNKINEKPPNPEEEHTPLVLTSVFDNCNESFEKIRNFPNFLRGYSFNAERHCYYDYENYFPSQNYVADSYSSYCSLNSNSDICKDFSKRPRVYGFEYFKEYGYFPDTDFSNFRFETSDDVKIKLDYDSYSLPTKATITISDPNWNHLKSEKEDASFIIKTFNTPFYFGAEEVENNNGFFMATINLEGISSEPQQNLQTNTLYVESSSPISLHYKDKMFSASTNTNLPKTNFDSEIIKNPKTDIPDSKIKDPQDRTEDKSISNPFGNPKEPKDLKNDKSVSKSFGKIKIYDKPLKLVNPEEPSKLIEEVNNTPLNKIREFSKDRISQFSPEVINGLEEPVLGKITIDQFSQLPSETTKSLSGAKLDQFKEVVPEITPQITQRLDIKAIATLSPDSKQKLPEVTKSIFKTKFASTIFGSVGQSIGENFIPSKLFLAPLKQIKNGILPEHVVCNDDLVLISWVHVDKSVCVSETSSDLLIERGIAVRIFN